MWAVDNVVGVEATGPGHRPMILGLFPTHHLLIRRDRNYLNSRLKRVIVMVICTHI